VPRAAFAIWITGRPGSGKSTLTRAVAARLAARGIDVAVLESDELRQVLTPRATYGAAERDDFYRALAHVGALLVEHGVPVIVDATANLRRYRDRARERLGRFVEVYVDTPLDECVRRDPKGLYRQAAAGGTATLPGVQAPYEAPEHPEVHVDGVREPPDEAARRVCERLESLGYVDG
jgi:adenylylsulfate kinase